MQAANPQLAASGRQQLPSSSKQGAFLGSLQAQPGALPQGVQGPQSSSSQALYASSGAPYFPQHSLPVQGSVPNR